MKKIAFICFALLIVARTVLAADDGRLERAGNIDIRVDFIEFKMDDIDLLTREGRFSAKELRAIWKKGDARLLCASQALTRSGQESISKGVTEYIYPSEFKPMSGVSTNQTSSATHPISVFPAAFEMRECGVILQVVSEGHAADNLINVTLNPQIIAPPVWKNYGTTLPADEADAETPPMEVPFFHVQSLSTSVTVANGIPVLIGGGMLNQDWDRAVYVFLTATLTDVEGNPLAAAGLPAADKPGN